MSFLFIKLIMPDYPVLISEFDVYGHASGFLESGLPMMTLHHFFSVRFYKHSIIPLNETLTNNLSL